MGERPATSTIRRARERSGFGVRQLARSLNVTPKAVLDWEKSEEKGTAQLNTIDRALRAMGESLVVESRRRVPVAGVLDRREDGVALELHRAVARKLIDDPERVWALAPENLTRLRRQVQGPAAESWVDEWHELCETHDVGGLVSVMLGTDRRSINMRLASPFLGVLTQDERLAAIARAGAR